MTTKNFTLKPGSFSVLLPSSMKDAAKGWGDDVDFEWELDEDGDSMVDSEDDGDHWREAEDGETGTKPSPEGFGGDHGEGDSRSAGADKAAEKVDAEEGDADTIIEADDALTEGETHETVKGMDDADPFGDMSSTLPTMTMETTDELLGEIAGDAAQAELTYTAEGKELPYTPHPEAAKADHVVVYDAADESYRWEMDSVRKSVGAMSRTIAAQLRRILHTTSLSRTQRDQQRGTLDRSKLHTLNRPGFAQPNRRVFSRTIQGQSHDIAIGLLVDQSGSMGGSKIRCAREATVALADALDQLAPLGVKFGVWGFDSQYASKGYMSNTDRCEPLRFHHYKGVDEQWNRVSSRVGAMAARDNNCDGESVRWAAHQLLDVKNVSRRILIVLSDGSPACQTSMGYHRIAADLKNAVGEMNELGVETFGLGIMDSSVERFYPDNAVIESARDLESTLMDKLRNMLLGSTRRVA